MDQKSIGQLKEDFLAWSGGFPPESDEQITVYVDYARSSDLDAEDTREALRRWMAEDGVTT